MKKYLSILIITLLSIGTIFITSCEREIKPEKFSSDKVNFSYSSSSIHYVVGEEIQFNNLSSEEGSWAWDFGDGTTSSEKNPTHKYFDPGTYEVTLTVDGSYAIKKNILISDIVPVVNYTYDGQSIVYNQTPVNFSVQIENPENKPIELKWSFPKGTVGDNIDENGVSTVQNPTATFGSIGSQIVSLNVIIEGNELSPVNVNVKVNYNAPAKTLYYAVKGGNIMSKKIIESIDPEINNSFDFGYRSGKHPLTMQYENGWIYVFDAGTRFSFVPAPAYTTAGDGEIFVISDDGEKRETVVENFGGDTNMDFYYGYVDADEGLIYWLDRREGIFKTPINTRNKKFSFSEFSYFVRNNWLGYYGDGLSWGNTNGTFYKRNNTYWWAKHTTGAGIFKFTDSDILGRPKADGDPQPEAGSILRNFGIRSFVIDEANERVYFSEGGYKFIGRCNLDGSDIKVIERVEDDGEGGSSEPLFVTSMAIDGEYLYWSYRGPNPPEGENPEDFYAANPNLRSGIKRLKLNDPNAAIEYFVKDVKVYGIAIDKIAK